MHKTLFGTLLYWQLLVELIANNHFFNQPNRYSVPSTPFSFYAQLFDLSYKHSYISINILIYDGITHTTPVFIGTKVWNCALVGLSRSYQCGHNSRFNFKVFCRDVSDIFMEIYYILTGLSVYRFCHFVLFRWQVCCVVFCFDLSFYGIPL